MRSWLIFILLLAALSTAYSQSRYEWGLIPLVNIGFKSNPDFKFNLKLESRNTLSEGFISELSGIDAEHRFNDVNLSVTRRIWLTNSLTLGVMYRFGPGVGFTRLIQQYTIVGLGSRFRMSHRLASDQNIDGDGLEQLRLRYRLAFELPLEGRSTDGGEAYAKLSQESLNVFDRDEYDLEFRLNGALGFKFEDNNKLEWGAEYRFDGFLHSRNRHRLFLRLNWYLLL